MRPVTEEQKDASRLRRLKKYMKEAAAMGLPTGPLRKEQIAYLEAQGWCNADGSLTDAGRLKVHQLEILAWMAKDRKKKKEQQRQKDAIKTRERLP